MRMPVLLVFLLLPILVVSGCIDVSGWFGDKQPMEKYPNDILVIENLKASKTEVYPNEMFTISGYVKNKGKMTVENITIEIYNYCDNLFNIEAVKCRGGTLNEKNTICTIPDMREFGEKEVVWTLRAPSKEALSGVGFKCNPIIKTTYKYATATQRSIIIRPETEETKAEGEEVLGHGPVKFRVNTEKSVYSGFPFDATFVIKNEGSGKVVDNKIYNDKIEIKVDSGLEMDPSKCEPELKSSGDHYVLDIDEDSFELKPMDGEERTTSIHCSFTAPSVTEVTTKYLTASITEYYYQFEHKDIWINAKPQKDFYG